MPELFGPDIMWIAQRHGQDWRDGSVLAAADWLESLVPSAKWQVRAAAVETRFQAAKAEWAAGRRVPLFDPKDTVAWYLHQARRYADPELRSEYFLPEGYRIAPLMRRIGQLLQDFRDTDGAEERAARLMTSNLSQPDDGIYELLVAGAYRRRGYDKVSFVPEAPGLGKRHDLLVNGSKSQWAVECKRAGRSDYGRDERLVGERMGEQAHALSRASGRSLLVSARYEKELYLLGDDYLVAKVHSFLNNDGPFEWDDEGGSGVVMDVAWGALHNVMTHDDIYFGSSRMFELLAGGYNPSIDFTMAGDWEPAEGRPLHATWVNQVSLVAWRSVSEEAARRKATHFRSLVAQAAKQFPGDRPGVIHVGYETIGGNSAEGQRHDLNLREMRTFDAGTTGLQIVYGNYFMSELVTARNESAAVVETIVPYPVGGAKDEGPLPGHMLFMDEDGLPGSHLR